MCLFGLRICSIAVVVCNGSKTKICTRLFQISSFSVIQKLGNKLFLFLFAHIKSKKIVLILFFICELDFVGFEPIAFNV